MVKYNNGSLDAVFSALADPTRRGILAALANGERSVTELAQPHGMSLPGFMKHLRILEDAGLVAREKEGRVVTCTLSAEPLRDVEAWIAHYRQFWDARLDALARYLEKENDSWPLPMKAPNPPKSRRSRSSASSRPPRKKSGARSRNPKR